jgi:hypothetical protein
MAGQVQTEEEYQAILVRIVAGAKKMTNPLLEKEDLAKMERVYNALCEEAEHYRIRDYARSFPYIREFYEEQGKIGKDEIL